VAFRPHLAMGLAFSACRKLSVISSGAKGEAQGGFCGVEMVEVRLPIVLVYLAFPKSCQSPGNPGRQR
jgi:hypothetical protein